MNFKFRIFLIFLNLALILTTMTACRNTSADKNQNRRTTTDFVTESVTEESMAAETTTEDTTKKSTIKHNEKLNMDLLSDLGLTYSQIEAKRGKQIKEVMHNGGYGYLFENSFGYYFFSGRGFSEKDINGNPIPFIVDKEKCSSIWLTNTKDLFLGLSQAIDVFKIEKTFGVNYVKTYWNELENSYSSVFEYVNIMISIETAKKDVIEPDSLLWLSIYEIR